MDTQNKTVGSLYTFVKNNEILDDLEARINKLNNDMILINEKIVLCEEYDDEEAADYLAGLYNEKNLERIQLELKANAVKQEILLFELGTALAY